MIKINFKNGCLFVLLLFIIGTFGVWYRQWEMENFYSQSIKECLENPPNNNDADNNADDNADSNADKKMCDEACTLAPINTQITTINTRIDLLEKISDKHDAQIKSNTEIVTKTSSDLKALQDEIDKTKAELEEATKEQSPE